MVSRLSTGRATVEIRDYVWQQPLDATIADDCATFGMSLSPVPSRSRARLETERGFRPIGRMLYRPPHQALHCLNAGGHQRLVLCTIGSEAPARCGDGDLGRMLDSTPPNIDLRNDMMAQALRRLAMEALEPGFGAAMLVDGLIDTLLIAFARSCGARPDDPAPSTGGLAPWQRRRIDEALRAPEGPRQSVADLAALVGVTPRHLLRAFRTSAGSSVSAHIARIRFERACALLVSSDLPIKQVAAEAGFDSAGGFAVAFRKEAGVSPREYRTRWQTKRPFRRSPADQVN